MSIFSNGGDRVKTGRMKKRIVSEQRREQVYLFFVAQTKRGCKLDDAKYIVLYISHLISSHTSTCSVDSH